MLPFLPWLCIKVSDTLLWGEVMACGIVWEERVLPGGDRAP